MAGSIDHDNKDEDCSYKNITVLPPTGYWEYCRLLFDCVEDENIENDEETEGDQAEKNGNNGRNLKKKKSCNGFYRNHKNILYYIPLGTMPHY